MSKGDWMWGAYSMMNKKSEDAWQKLSKAQGEATERLMRREGVDYERDTKGIRPEGV